MNLKEKIGILSIGVSRAIHIQAKRLQSRQRVWPNSVIGKGNRLPDLNKERQCPDTLLTRLREILKWLEHSSSSIVLILAQQGKKLFFGCHGFLHDWSGANICHSKVRKFLSWAWYFLQECGNIPLHKMEIFGFTFLYQKALEQTFW